MNIRQFPGPQRRATATPGINRRPPGRPRGTGGIFPMPGGARLPPPPPVGLPLGGGDAPPPGIFPMPGRRPPMPNRPVSVPMTPAADFGVIDRKADGMLDGGGGARLKPDAMMDGGGGAIGDPRPKFDASTPPWAPPPMIDETPMTDDQSPVRRPMRKMAASPDEFTY